MRTYESGQLWHITHAAWPIQLLDIAQCPHQHPNALQPPNEPLTFVGARILVFQKRLLRWAEAFPKTKLLDDSKNLGLGNPFGSKFNGPKDHSAPCDFVW